VSNVNLFPLAERVEDVVKFVCEVRRKIHGLTQTPTGPGQSDLVLMWAYTPGPWRFLPGFRILRGVVVVGRWISTSLVEGKSMVWWIKSKGFGSGDHGDFIATSIFRTT